MASKVVHLTEAGLQKIKSELEHLRSVERPAISAAIAEARDKGDLSENAEYDAAKEAQGMLEMRIAKLEEMVANARVLDESRIDTSSVQILNRVTLKNMKTGKTVEYTLVSESEANLKEGKLAIGTPIAQALLGQGSPGGKLSLIVLVIHCTSSAFASRLASISLICSLAASSVCLQ